MDRSYQLVVVAANRDPVASDTASKVAPDMTFTEALPTDALFVVGGGLASVRAAEDAALLPSPLPGLMPFFTVIEKPTSSHPQSSASFIAAYDAVFLSG